MAVKRKPTTPARRRPAPRKKTMSPIAKVAIGVGAATALYLIYDNFIKPKDTTAGATIPAQNTAQQVIQQAQQLPVNALPPQSPPKKVSPIGTPASKQSWSRIIQYKEKSGEVQTLQGLLNRVSKAYGQPLLKVDGDYGSATEQKKAKILGSRPVNLSTAYKITKKQLEAKNAPTDVYDIMYNTALQTIGLMF